MKLRFTWAVDAPNRMVAACDGCINVHGISPICALLTDNGGFLDAVALPYVQMGIETVDAVLRGDLASGSWTREWLAAEFDADVVRIYSIRHEEEYRQRITTVDFRRILVAWRDFIQSEPRDGTEAEVDMVRL